MAENRRGKDNRFYFSRGQMVLLGGAFTLTSPIIFFLGVFVGKGIEERRLLAEEEPLSRSRSNPTLRVAAAAAAAASRKTKLPLTILCLSPRLAVTASTANRASKVRSEKVVKAETKDAKSQAKAEARARSRPRKKPKRLSAARKREKKGRAETAAHAKIKDKFGAPK